MGLKTNDFKFAQLTSQVSDLSCLMQLLFGGKVLLNLIKLFEFTSHLLLVILGIGVSNFLQLVLKRWINYLLLLWLLGRLLHYHILSRLGLGASRLLNR